MGDAELLHVQVLIGMVILFQGTRDLKPATMLIAIALRLAHELGLHTRRSVGYLDATQVLERDRVFWIAYILDRDISLRTNRPPYSARPISTLNGRQRSLTMEPET